MLNFTSLVLHVLVLLNEVPASSTKYQLIMEKAEKIMEDNARHGHSALLHVNRTAFASSFTRSSTPAVTPLPATPNLTVGRLR
ncbi:hypothetical protein F3Y22_tig00112343pilonHSYRG00105 [Hibiscus syriacus]|uniref:Uncharacterized protein n=1 Tax=Hibiscus syriacus TaxID=106335 RepID=A0A6A2X1G9_HIBSY|nr:hypothetical protein F3Y22_tig00112343pilonHSYRG00105 [Hibiscus syriacus]